MRHATARPAPAPARLPGVGPLGCESCGVISCVYSHSGTPAKIHAETVRSMRVLRSVMDRSVEYPTVLFASRAATEVLNRSDSLWLWEQRRELRMVPPLQALLRARELREEAASAFLWKLSALLSSGFGRTLFLDADVYVVDPRFVGTLLAGSLSIGDVVWPIDIGRYIPAFKNTAAPMHCSCVMAYRESKAVRGWLVDAAARLINGTNRGGGVRQTDQEMMHFAWCARGLPTRHTARARSPRAHTQRPPCLRRAPGLQVVAAHAPADGHVARGILLPEGAVR